MTNEKQLLLANKLEIVETVDGDWMVLQGGFQVGGKVDTSGAGDQTFHTWREAYAYALDVARKSHV